MEYWASRYDIQMPRALYYTSSRRFGVVESPRTQSNLPCRPASPFITVVRGSLVWSNRRARTYMYTYTVHKYIHAAYIVHKMHIHTPTLYKYTHINCNLVHVGETNIHLDIRSLQQASSLLLTVTGKEGRSQNRKKVCGYIEELRWWW